MSRYGASTSLQILLNNLENVSFDIIGPKTIHTSLGREKLPSLSLNKKHNIWFHHLPFDFCYKNKPCHSIKHYLGDKLLINLLWNATRRKTYSRIESGKYDFIHLNSLVLHEMITRKDRYILHVREIYDGSNPTVFESLRKSEGVIFIDKETEAPFSQEKIKNSIILNNPIDMTPLKGISWNSIPQKYYSLKNFTIFSLIGTVTEGKGASFVIKCFKRTKNHDSRLLIVGKGDEKYISSLKDLAAGDSRIIFWGEEADIKNIYFISDYVLRGESFQCIGRTIYEGLYSGCGVLIPATDDGEKFIFEYKRFKELINLYYPRNEDSFIAMLEDLSRKKIRHKTSISNVGEYSRKFTEFIAKIVNGQQ